jgi:hypothetical protein
LVKDLAQSAAADEDCGASDGESGAGEDGSCGELPDRLASSNAPATSTSWSSSSWSWSGT